ncbi:Hsp20/alpha crystallin family protein [Desulfogranum japonicum]|uniref:Hsp20/alpha crystallin family protein n=1 Tax=Desulfogranum japonicum TaxID=231447 RepID=UPI0003FD0917|nr:Hsp20/alpha crystallin family protein [Desulfogranum japonicum]
MKKDKKAAGDSVVTQNSQGKTPLSRPREIDLLDEMQRFFETSFATPWWYPFSVPKLMTKNWNTDLTEKIPSVNVVEHDDLIEVTAELPGVDKKDLSLSLANNVLTISAETSREKKEDREGEYHHREISMGVYKRSLVLPAEVKEEEITATLNNGVLTIQLPKLAKAKRTQIEVQ